MSKTTIVHNLMALILISVVVTLHIHAYKQKQLDKIKSEKAYDKLWKKYEWKTKRLKVYTGLVYNRDYSND